MTYNYYYFYYNYYDSIDYFLILINYKCLMQVWCSMFKIVHYVLYNKKHHTIITHNNINI